MDYLSYVTKAAKTVTQTRVAQWMINKVRENVYPWVYNKWEADLILEESNIWLGSLESACDRHALRMKGITHVVSAVYNINPIFPDDPELMYLKVPVIDAPNADIAKHFDKAIDFIHTAVEKNQGVLIHCVFGISRSATLLCAYLIKKHGMNVKTAVEYVKQRRPKAEPNKGFLVQLEAMNLANEPIYNYFPKGIMDEA